MESEPAMPTRAFFGFWLPDFCEVVSVGLVVLSVSEEPALVLPVLLPSVEALEAVPAAAALIALVTIPILERHEVKKIPAAEEASNNIKFFLYVKLYK